MGLIKIRFEIMNDVQFSRAFETAISKVANLTEPFTEMADDFFQTMSGVFEAEGAYEERTKWQDLSPAYARWKARHYPGRKILELTGRMKRSLTVKGGADNVLMISPTEMSVGTRVPYAVLHQTGTSKLPMRKVIELTASEKKRWVQIVHRYLFEVYDTAAKATRQGG